MANHERPGPVVSLTFDNGPWPGVTDAVLEELARRELPATFFVVGDLLVGEGLDLARRAVAEGHRLGNHTHTHTLLLGAAEDATAAVAAEIEPAAARLASLDGEEKLFRPYAAGGVLDHQVLNSAAVSYLVAHEYTCVLWNSLPRDWEDPDGWTERACADVADQPWTVVVLHDAPTGAMKQLPRFLDALADMEAEVRPDFPESCLPIRRGRVEQDLSSLLPTSCSE
jgi:peptidoglycan/xylan/chitin deacetylase (PgdA/CDA1 family)